MSHATHIVTSVANLIKPKAMYTRAHITVCTCETFSRMVFQLEIEDLTPMYIHMD